MGARLTLAHDQRRNNSIVAVVVVAVMVGSSKIKTKETMVAVKVRMYVSTLGCILVRESGTLGCFQIRKYVCGWSMRNLVFILQVLS